MVKPDGVGIRPSRLSESQGEAALRGMGHCRSRVGVQF